MASITRSGPVGWIRSHPFAADAMFAVALLSLSLPTFLTGTRDHPEFRAADPLGWVLVLLQIAPLAWRRSHPDRVLAVIGVSTVVYEAFGYVGGAASLGVLVAVYSVAAHADRRTSRLALLVTAVLLTVGLTISRSDIDRASFVANYFIFFTAWVVGDNLRNRRARVAELEDRAARLERERELQAARAIAEERQRIARELHDVVAHSVSVMVVQAQAAKRTLARSPDQATAALDSIEDCGRSALDELRRVVGVLRRSEDVAETAPQPTVADIDTLVSQVTEAGLCVEYQVEGDVRPLPPGIDLSAYRIVQEALTNALKHAGPARARVVVSYGERSLRLTVADDGRGAAVAARPGGHGLIGMRERVSMFGGSINTGPRSGGGYEVTAELPLESVG